MGSFGKSDSESESSSNFSQSVWDQQAPALTRMYDQASGLFNQTNAGLMQQTPFAVNAAKKSYNTSNPYWQNQLQGGVYQNLGLGNQLMNSLNQSMNKPSNMSQVNAMIMGGNGNNYADAMRQQYINDADSAHKMMLNNTRLGAVDAGQVGSSRHGIAEALGTQNVLNNLQKNLTQVGYNTFDKDLDRKLNIAQQADQNTLSRQQMMSDMLSQQQATQNAGLNFGNNMANLGLGALTPYIAPWDAMASYANVLGRPTVLGEGNMSGESESDSFGLSIF